MFASFLCVYIKAQPDLLHVKQKKSGKSIHDFLCLFRFCNAHTHIYSKLHTCCIYIYIFHIELGFHDDYRTLRWLYIKFLLPYDVRQNPIFIKIDFMSLGKAWNYDIHFFLGHRDRREYNELPERLLNCCWTEHPNLEFFFFSQVPCCKNELTAQAVVMIIRAYMQWGRYEKRRENDKEVEKISYLYI